MYKKLLMIIVSVVIGGFIVIMDIGCPSSPPPPPTIVTISSPHNGASVSESFRVSGTYENLDDDDDIWVIVWPELSPNKGWPQSDNAATGTPAMKADGQWSVTCFFGGPAQNYLIIVYTVKPSASQFLSSLLQQWYRNNNYPGIFIADLPTPGLKEEHRIQVKKP